MSEQSTCIVNGGAPITRSEGSPKIRAASLDDYEQIFALQLRNGLDTRSSADWSALWTKNPACTRAGSNPSIGWVLEASEGEVVGFVGNLPLQYRFQGRDVRAATAYSWAVDLPYRGYSMALLDRFVSQKDVELLVFATVNSAAEKVYRALRFARVPAGTWDRSAFWITDYLGFARSALRAASVPLPRLLAYPLSAALSLVDVFAKRPPARSAGCELELCSAFDSRFDGFWEELECENQDRLLAVRSRETLEWHFRYSLERGRVWILTASAGGRLAAYAIFDRQDIPAFRLRRVRFVDFQALSGFEHLLEPILGWMVHRCRQAHIHVAENVGCWLDRRLVARTCTPYYRKMKSWNFYYRAREGGLARLLQDPRVWAPASFDGDASI